MRKNISPYREPEKIMGQIGHFTFQSKISFFNILGKVITGHLEHLTIPNQNIFITQIQYLINLKIVITNNTIIFIMK